LSCRGAIKWSQKHESFLVTTTRLSKKRLATGSPDRPRYLLTDRKIEPFQEKELSPSLEIKQGVIGIWRGWLIFRGSDGMNHVLDHGMSQEGRLRIFPTIDANWYFFEGSEWDIALRLDFSAAIPNVAEKVYFFDHRGWFESIVGYIFGTRDDLRRRYGADNVRFYPSPGLGGCIGYSQAMKRVSRCDGHIFEQGQFVDRTAQFGNSKYWYLDDATAVNIPIFRTDSGKLLYYKNDKFHALEYSSFANAVNIQNLPRSNKSFIVSNNSISEIRMDSDRLSLTEISGKKIKSEGTNKGTWWHAKILQIPESKQLIIFGHDSLHLLNGAKSRIGWKPANGSIDLTSHIAPIEIGKWRGIMFALRNHNQEVIALKLVTLERRYCSS